MKIILQKLDYRTVPKSRRHQADGTAPVEALTSERLDWAGLVQAVWELGPGEELHGRLPRGLAQQQFRAKVQRAAGRMEGAVGVCVRGEEWWVWKVRRGILPAERVRGEIRQREGKRDLVWRDVRKALEKADGAPVRINGVLEDGDRKRLEKVAAGKWGMVLVTEVKGEWTMVQQVGEV